MKGDRKGGLLMLIPAVLLAIAVIACGSTTNGQPEDDGNGVYKTSTPEVERFLTSSLEEFTSQLSQAIVDHDPETMATLMRDPFEVNARGAGRSRRQPLVALEHIERFYPPEGIDIECGEEPPETIGNDLAIGTANSYLTREADVYCTGWGADGSGEALLLIHMDIDGYYYWTVFAVATAD